MYPIRERRCNSVRSKDKDKMNEIVNFINRCYFKESYVPTIQEIADHMGMAKGNAQRYLQEMAERDMIELGTGWKSVKTNRMLKDCREIYKTPILGSIACGSPLDAEENIESFITLSRDLLGPGEFFGLWAHGDSMINADISDGDLVIVRVQNDADDGDIVVALCDGEKATLKRFYRDDERQCIRLHPENDEMEDMYYQNVQIQGIAVKVLKNI